MFAYFKWFKGKYTNNKINKRESRVGINIYYIGYVLYKFEYIANSVVPLYLNVKSLLGRVEKINGSSDRYLVIDKSNIEVINVFNTIKEYVQSTIIKDNSIKIDGFDKIRFSSDIDLPSGKLIEFKVLTIIIKCIIKKMINTIQKFIETNVCTERSNTYKMNNTSDSNIRELKIDSTLWATPAKIINLLDLKQKN